MAEKTVVSVLAGYFNQGDGKRPLSKFLEELKALSPTEKRELAEGVVAITGNILKS